MTPNNVYGKNVYSYATKTYNKINKSVKNFLRQKLFIKSSHQNTVSNSNIQRMMIMEKSYPLYC